MFRNYLKIAWRNLLKHKYYSLINIVGLALGAAICLLIVLFIQSERSVDSWRQDADNVYRMVVKRKYPTRESSYSIIPQSYAMVLKEELPEVESAVRVFNFFDNGTLQVKYRDEQFEETGILMADPGFFDMFKSELLYGSDTGALSEPNSIVLNETTAKKYFRDPALAVGQFVVPEINDEQPLQVTAVYRDWPEASHFNFNAIISTAGNDNFEQENFVGFSAHTYFRLHEGAEPEAVEAAMPRIIRDFAAGHIQRSFSMSIDDFMAAGNGYTYYLQPMQDIYLTSHLENELRVNGSETTLYIFGLVAVFILFIACVNFINLATARSSERAREVGIRKTFGSIRRALIIQFIAESFLMSILAMVAAVGLFALLVPVFNDISGKSFAFASLFTPNALLLLLVFTCVTGSLAGIYPAFVLSRFNPIQVLRGKFKTGSQGRNLRSGLVVFQFAISVILIICTLIVNRQMKYMTSERLGFNKEQTLILERTDLLGNDTRAFKNELIALQGIRQVSGATALPGQQNYFGVSWATLANRNEPITGRGIIVDEAYAETLELELVAGRFFSRDFPTDSLAVVINEKAAAELGLDDPLGQRLITPEEFLNANDGSAYTYTVIGVIRDYHYQSLHEPITPLVFTSGARFNQVMQLTAVRVAGGTMEDVLADIRGIWQKFVPEKPLTFQFLDQTIANQYDTERTARKVFTFFSFITIFIACIGLLGLAAYTTRQRVHEIGIRKVLGASVSTIVMMLSRNFVKLVGIATLIALPIAWLFMDRWLQNFSYRIDSSWDLFIWASGIALVTAFLTISFQAVKAAVQNPVKSLRTE